MRDVRAVELDEFRVEGSLPVLTTAAAGVGVFRLSLRLAVLANG